MENNVERLENLLETLDKYLIINRQTGVKLSEIMNKLNFAFPRIERTDNIIHVYNGKALMFNISYNRLCPINIQPYNETKWIYKLWLSKTQIIDDL